jgi:hypothetical protein
MKSRMSGYEMCRYPEHDACGARGSMPGSFRVSLFRSTSLTPSDISLVHFIHFLDISIYFLLNLFITSLVTQIRRSNSLNDAVMLGAPAMHLRDYCNR